VVVPVPVEASARKRAVATTKVPEGGAPPRSQFNGEVYNRDGEHVPPGTRVEAYAGDTLCGVGSTRRVGSYSGYILDVVGPDSVAGCERDATLTFRIDGQPAVETAVNELGGGGTRDLTVR